jgi:hypothetical protein
LFDHTGALIAANDNWKDTQQAQIQATGLAPRIISALRFWLLFRLGLTLSSSKERQWPPASSWRKFTMSIQVQTRSRRTWARALFVGTGNDVLIGGTIMRGNSTGLLRVLVRAPGPSLASAGVTTPLANPTLSLRDANGNVIANNDNWKDSQQAAIAVTGNAPER